MCHHLISLFSLPTGYYCLGVLYTEYCNGVMLLCLCRMVPTGDAVGSTVPSARGVQGLVGDQTSRWGHNS